MGTGRKAVSVGPLTKVTDTFYLQIRLKRTGCLDASETDANRCAYSDVKQKSKLETLVIKKNELAKQ